ncbi:MAG: hypothetical protein WCD11_07355 [Solirubrobacteraceae bacterium]
MAIFDLVSNADVTHVDRSGGNIGLITRSEAKQLIWPDLANWVAERSKPDAPPMTRTVLRSR